MGGERGDSPAIKPISKAVVHRICSGQVIFDLSSAVKELVENSLDAGATSIEVNLKEYGEEWFKVIDNGCGISPNNFQALALKHHTSKISDFSDLTSLTTYGFRGEALSSLCALGKLTVETRTKNEQVATHLEFEHSGVVINDRKTARQVGTTVTVAKLFSTLPVRNKEFSRNIRKEYGKLVSLLNAYALIAKGVRLLCTNTVGRNSKTMVIKTQGSSSLKDNIITIFGLSTFQCLEPLSISISEGCQIEGFLSKPGHGSGRNLGDRQFFYINGRPVDMPKVSKLINELYRSSNAKQYPVAILNFCIPTTSYDVNVTPDKRKIFFSAEGSVMLSLRTAFEKIYCPQQCIYSVNCIEDPESEAHTVIDESNEDADLIERENISSAENDMNKEALDNDYQVSPKSRQVFSPEPKVAVGASPRDESPLLRDPASEVDISARLSGFRYKQPKGSSSAVKSNSGGTSRVKAGWATKHSQSNIVQSSLTNFVSVNKRKHEDSYKPLSEVPVLRNGACVAQVRKTSSETQASAANSLCMAAVPQVDSPQRTELSLQHSPQCFVSETTEISPQLSPSLPALSEGAEIPHSGQYDDHSNGTSEDEPREEPLPKFDAPKEDSEVLPRNILSTDQLPNAHDNDNGPQKSCSASVSFPVMQFTVAELRRRRKQGFLRSRGSLFSYQEKRTKCYMAATLNNSQPKSDEGKSNSLAAATNELDRLFSKDNFGEMQVVGQFNLGFIIGKLDQDLFIVDQHAADEKYNFESLSHSTILNIQPLLQPVRLELSPEEEIVASMHMNTIRKNGFVLAEDMLAPPGQHFLLKAVPFSKNITFGAQDVKELISMLADSQGDCSIIGSYKLDRTDSICPSRVRSMLASRACRMSTMIGDPLTKIQMKKILTNLTGLRSPWNCPHGRPTMRHLADLGNIKSKETKMMLSQHQR